MRLIGWMLVTVAFCAAALPAAAQQSWPALLPPPAAAPVEPTPADAPHSGDVVLPSTPWQPPPTITAAPTVAPAPTVEETLPMPDAGETTQGVAAEAAGLGEGVIEEKMPTWYERAFMLVPAPWDTGIELGLNGSSGTSDSFSLRTGGYIKRSSRFSKLDVSTYYNRTGNGGELTQNNAQFDFRNDWLLDEQSPWTLFATNTEFYDQFKDFDLQMNIDAGVGYRVFHDKDLELIGRVGGGTSREFGGVDDRWVPESLFGFEYSQQLSATQKFYGKLDWFPEWDQVGEYRLVADTGWEVVLVQPSNLSLKISATDRYDSTPNGAEPHLLNYSVLLLLKL
jgi:hypothetical protein